MSTPELAHAGRTSARAADVAAKVCSQQRGYRGGDRPQTVMRRLPVNLATGDSHLFSAAIHAELPPANVTVHRDVEAFGRGPLRKHGQYLAESFADPLHLRTWLHQRGHWRAAIERSFQPARQIDRPVVWITDNWSCGYYHWMCDALPRLEAALLERDASELTLLLPSKFRRAEYFRSSLQPFNLREVRFLNRFERIRCRQLVLPSHLGTTGNYDGPLMQSLARRLRSFATSCRNAGRLGGERDPERIYISRRLAGRRRIVNEAELMPVLEKHRFATCVAERLPWRRQVELAASADFLVSNHGAGLSNMLAMSPGTNVMEIRERHDDCNNCYFTLASATRLHYHYLLAEKQDPRQSVHRSNLLVDPERLDAALTEMITARNHRLCA